MISFTCDYIEGAHPEILRRLAETNLVQEPGYGEDSFTRAAVEKIRKAADAPKADVFLLVGGTQTNATVIDAMLPHYGAVIAAQTGHIAVHESGAIEHSGHKVITLPAKEGKIQEKDLRDYLEAFYADPTWPHMAQPGMVYLSFPSEYGTIYSKKELQGIYAICRQYDMPLFIDGARLGYGLASPATDVDLAALAKLCDVFYIGGTKVGALCGEAVVFPRGNAPKNFFTIVKQHGALMAKGRLLGIQFDTLFQDNLYLEISRNAVREARRIREALLQKGYELYIDSPTNQIFTIVTKEKAKALREKVLYGFMEELGDGRLVIRFCTSWASRPEDVDELISIL